jgi:cell division initiation protein
MIITPVEIRHVKLRRGVLGYRRRATDELLEQIVESYEEAWRGRAEREDQVERLEAELARFRELENLLRDTMMSAERAAETLRSDARREYELTLQEARLKAREVVEHAEAEAERMHAEVRRLRTAKSELRLRMETALARLEDDVDPGQESATTGELTVPGQAA